MFYGLLDFLFLDFKLFLFILKILLGISVCNTVLITQYPQQGEVAVAKIKY